MRVVVVGGGGRERAIAWACHRHGHETEIVAGIDEVLAAGDSIDLVIPGPEQVLVDGIADRCAEAGIACFGPMADLARLESSKSHARELATALGIPGPRWARFTAGDHPGAHAWWHDLGAPVVVKLDGLASGKGVVVPADDAETAAAIDATTSDFVVEERLSGPEVSLLALCDGERAVALPLAQDHKRIGEADTGPNTGGMGAIAPAPFDLDVDELLATFVQPVLDHLRAAGTPYVGVLYAGLMLTVDGPRLIEYNVRFGDPETQAVLALLETDLAQLALAATRGELASVPLRLIDGAACTVVAAAAGYPGEPTTGAAVTIPEDLVRSDAREMHCDEPDTVAVVFEAAMIDGCVSGGRVLAVTGVGADLAAARECAYEAIGRVHFDGMYYRRDIGWRAPGARLGSYAAAGVDIDEGERAVDAMRAAVERTHNDAVLGGVGSFGGVFSAAALREMDHPLLVASTDGVGTKVELAQRAGRLEGIGADLVNHCINDVLVQGARPLFFLDYLAASTIEAERVATVVTSMAEACEAAGCALLGGETAEMPGVYLPGALDVAGTLIGVAEAERLLPAAGIGPGDVLVGIASSGPHTNGYSLIRRLVEWLPLEVVPDGFEVSLGEALLTPHRSYLELLWPVIDRSDSLLKGLAHITGGGLPGNVIRVLPDGVTAQIELGSWPVPPLFALIRDLAVGLDADELYRTLNMGVGMVAVGAPERVDELRDAIGEQTWVIGELIASDGPAAVRLVSA
jgi:phosphoribosylamine--glycine ligase/phosphoribosylformylglycinamidine cyclo-ligase